MIIEGLDTSVSEMLQDEAFTQAQKWIRGNYKAYVKTEAMFEKVVIHLQFTFVLT